MTALSAPFDSRELAARVLDCFPSGTYGMPALLRVLELVATEEVPTAAIECRAQPRMLINPRFVERHAETPEKLLVLILHELHHLLLGHTRLYPRATPLENLVFDAVINATLARLLPGPEHLSFLTDFYDDAQFPACFLRPAPGWTPDAERPPLPRALTRASSLPPAVRTELGELHAALYSERGTTYSELSEALQDHVAAEATPLLLGDHSPEEEGASSAGLLEHRTPVLFETVRRITERWPRPPNPIRGRSPHSILEEHRVEPPPPRNAVLLRRLLQRVAGRSGRGRLRRPIEREDTVATPIPRLGRRSLVLRALGARPLLHEATLRHLRPTPGGERVHVYLDVSGSMGGLVGPLAAAITHCRNSVYPTVHQFSDRIADVTLAELRRGVVRTTGGTAVDCIVSHARKNGVRRAVLITDGWVGRPTEEQLRTLQAMTIGLALTPDYPNADDLAGVIDHLVQLRPEGDS